MKKKSSQKRYSTLSSTSASKLITKIKKQHKPETGSVDLSKKEYESKEKDWYIFASAFLNIAKNSCDNIILKKKLSSDDKFIFIGIIYNVKHGLEVILKAFARTINKKLDKSDYDHDINRLMKDFREKIKKKINKNNNLKEEMGELEIIIEKYYNLKFFNHYLKDDFIINDLRNTFFRYPENKTEIKIDYSKFLSQIKKIDIQNLRDDIDKIIEISIKMKKLIK